MVKNRTIKVKSIKNEEILIITTKKIKIKTVIIIMIIMIIKNCNCVKL